MPSSAKAELVDPSELEQDGGAGKEIGTHLPLSYALCVAIFAHEENAVDKLEAKCRAFEAAVEEPVVEDHEGKKGPALSAPSCCVIAVSYLGPETTLEELAPPLQRYLETGLLKLYATDEAVYLLKTQDICEQVNSALQLGAWHGYDVLELCAVDKPTTSRQLPFSEKSWIG